MIKNLCFNCMHLKKIGDGLFFCSKDLHSDYKIKSECESFEEKN